MKDKQLNTNAIIGNYMAYHKIENKGMLVYGLNFSGFPTPILTSVTLLRSDHSDYCEVPIGDVVLYRCNI